MAETQRQADERYRQEFLSRIYPAPDNSRPQADEPRDTPRPKGIRGNHV